MVIISFDPRPKDAPHSVLTLVEMPASMIVSGGEPDPQVTQEQIGGVELTVIRRGGNCITYEWTLGDLYLQLTNPYDPPGQPRYTCEQYWQFNPERTQLFNRILSIRYWNFCSGKNVSWYIE